MRTLPALASFLIVASLEPALADAPAPPPRVDRYGDPLPDGAVARLGTVRLRHGAIVGGVAFSPDGRTVASAEQGGPWTSRPIYFWDVATGAEVGQLEGHQGGALSVAYSPDGRMLASAAAVSEEYRIWDTASGEELHRLPSLGGFTYTLAFSSDGRMLLGVSRVVLLWDVTTGREVRQLGVAGTFAASAAFSPDGKEVAAICRGAGLRIWDAATGKERRHFEIPDSTSWPLYYSPDGRLLLAVNKGNMGGVNTSDRAILFLDATTGAEVGRIEGYYFQCAFAPDSRTVVTQHRDGGVALWDVASGEELSWLPVGDDRLFGLAFSPDGRTVGAGDWGARIRLGDLVTGKERPTFAAHDAGINVVAASPDGKVAATAGNDRNILLWDLMTGKLLRRMEGHNARVMGLVFSADGYRLISVSPAKSDRGGDKDAALRFWDAKTGNELGKGWEGQAGFFALARSTDGKLVAAAQRSDVVLLDAATGNELRRMQGHSSGAWSLAFAPDGKTLASGGYDQLIILWEAATGKPVRKIMLGRTASGHANRVFSLAFAADGRTFLSASADGIRLWESLTGQERRRFLHGRPDDWLIGAGISQDGRMIAQGTPDGAIEFRDVESGKVLKRLFGHRGVVQTLVFTTDGKRLVSGASDTTALVWDLSNIDKSRITAAAHTDKELDSHWADLGGADAEKAFDAVWALAAAPNASVAFLSKRLQPTPAVNADAVARWIADLASEQFAVREAATRELERLRERARPALEKALGAQPAVGVRRRLEDLRGRCESPAANPDSRRELRAVEVLENIGTREAGQLLETLAQGAPEAWLTQDAKRSLERMTRNPGRN